MRVFAFSFLCLALLGGCGSSGSTDSSFQPAQAQVAAAPSPAPPATRDLVATLNDGSGTIGMQLTQVGSYLSGSAVVTRGSELTEMVATGTAAGDRVGVRLTPVSPDSRQLLHLQAQVGGSGQLTDSVQGTTGSLTVQERTYGATLPYDFTYLTIDMPSRGLKLVLSPKYPDWPVPQIRGSWLSGHGDFNTDFEPGGPSLATAQGEPTQGGDIVGTLHEDGSMRIQLVSQAAYVGTLILKLPAPLQIGGYSGDSTADDLFLPGAPGQPPVSVTGEPFHWHVGLIKPVVHR